MRMRVPSLASLSASGIQHYHELWCRSQTWLRSSVAVAVAYAGSYSSDSTPGPKASMCCACTPPQKKYKASFFFPLSPPRGWSLRFTGRRQGCCAIPGKPSIKELLCPKRHEACTMGWPPPFKHMKFPEIATNWKDALFQEVGSEQAPRTSPISLAVGPEPRGRSPPPPPSTRPQQVLPCRQGKTSYKQEGRSASNFRAPCGFPT